MADTPPNPGEVKDFDAARKRPDESAPVVQFKLFGKVWTAAEIPEPFLLDLLIADDQQAQLRGFDAIMRVLVIEEQRAEFNQLWHAGATSVPGEYQQGEERVQWPAGAPLPETAVAIRQPVPAIKALTGDEQAELVQYVAEQQQGRPTTPSSSS